MGVRGKGGQSDSNDQGKAAEEEKRRTYGEDTAVKEVLARREQRSRIGVFECAEEALAAAKVRYPGGDANPRAFSPTNTPIATPSVFSSAEGPCARNIQRQSSSA